MKNAAYVLKSDQATGDTSLPLLVRDPLLSGASNSAVRFLFDLGFGFCYPGGDPSTRAAPGNPAGGALVADVAEIGSGQVIKAAGQTIAYAGGGFDWSGLTNNGSYVEIPAGVANDLWTAYGGVSQQFIACVYVKLPVDADWNSTAGMRPFITWADGLPSSANPDIISLGQSTVSAVKYIVGQRQTSGATVTSTTLALPTGYTGTICQIAYVRNASNNIVTIRNAANGRSTLSGAFGSDNATNFSAQKGKSGVGSVYYSSGLATGNDAACSNYRTYRGFVENLARSGRGASWGTVLDDDWTRFAARIATGDFS